jgi:hypothetical protein
MWMMCTWKVFHLFVFYEGASTKNLWNKHELFYFFFVANGLNLHIGLCNLKGK